MNIMDIIDIMDIMETCFMDMDIVDAGMDVHLFGNLKLH